MLNYQRVTSGFLQISPFNGSIDWQMSLSAALVYLNWPKSILGILLIPPIGAPSNMKYPLQKPRFGDGISSFSRPSHGVLKIILDVISPFMIFRIFHDGQTMWISHFEWLNPGVGFPAHAEHSPKRTLERIGRRTLCWISQPAAATTPSSMWASPASFCFGVFVSGAENETYETMES